MAMPPTDNGRQYTEVLDTVAALERQLVMLSAQSGTRSNPVAQQQITQVRTMITDLKAKIRTFDAPAKTTGADTSTNKSNSNPMRSLFGSDPE